jgi:molybdate transport system substrate-binding protein
MAIAVKAIEAADPQLKVELITTPASGFQAAVSANGAAMVVSSDQAELGALAASDVIYQPVGFVRSKLELAVAPSDPLGVKNLADLEKPGVRVVLVASSTATGQASHQLIGADGLTVDVAATVATPAAAVAAIRADRADATLLELRDAVTAGSSIRAFEIPDEQNVITRYSLAMVRSASSGPEAGPAQNVARDLLGGSATQALLSAHYLLPVPASGPAGSSGAAGSAGS